MAELINNMAEFLDSIFEIDEIRTLHDKNQTESDYGIVSSGNVDFFPYDMYETLKAIGDTDESLENFEKVMYEEGERQEVTNLINHYKELIGQAVRVILSKD